jgi:hypothetical protein
MADTVENDKNSVELAKLIEYVDDYLDTSDDARAAAEQCRDYYDGKQWTASEMEVFRKRKQPVIVNNRVKPVVDTLKGMEIAGRTDPKAFARTPKHEKDADAATDAVRYVQDRAKFDSISSEVYENLLIEGLAGVDVVWDPDRKRIEINFIPFDRAIVDPYDRTKQCTQGRYTGYVTWKDRDEVEAMWPESKDDLHAQIKEWSAGSTSTFDDRPRWFDTRRDRIMIIEMYFMHMQKWHRAVFTKGVFLEKPEVSVYKDQDGVPTNPQIFCSPNINREGGRYGFVYSKLSMQDAINKRESKATDLLNRRQTFAKKGAIDNITAFKKEMNDSGGHVEFPPGPGVFGKDFGVLPNEQLVGPQLQMYENAINAFDAITRGGLAPENETNLSGRAIRALQQGRNMEVTPLRETYHQFLVRVATAIWERVRQFWKEETWIRVTDDDSNVRFVGLNRNKTVRDQVIEQMGSVPQEILQNPKMAAKLDQEVLDEDGKPIPMNKVASLDVDIFLEEVPDVLTLQQEIFEMLVELASARPEIPFELIIESSPLPARTKARLLQKPEQTVEQQQQAEMAKQLEMAQIQAKVGKDAAAAAKDNAAATQTEKENELLDRFMAGGQGPNQVIV